MNKAQMLFVILLLAPPLSLYFLAGGDACALCPAGLPPYGWAVALCTLAAAGLLLARWGGPYVRGKTRDASPAERRQKLTNEQRLKYDPEGPDYPHPVVITDTCIGCYRCIEACPHDVLTVKYTPEQEPVAAVAAADLCLDDTSCEAACPVAACVVVNTDKQTRPQKKPDRDESFMSKHLPGCYVVGDVSGAPLIANAVAEGAAVIEDIRKQLAAERASSGAELDVAIVGAGPAGLSAAVAAKQSGLKFVAVERKRVLATVEAFGTHKYVALKRPKSSPAIGLRLSYPGRKCGDLLDAWKGDAASAGVVLNPTGDEALGSAVYEQERCTNVERAADGSHLVVTTVTERPPARQKTYRARRVVLAIGRSEPRKLNDRENVVPGEEEARVRRRLRRGGREEEVDERKVLYELTDPELFRGLNLVVLGSGNSAVEAAVDLVARRDGDRITFLDEAERNKVTMLVRGTGFKPDVTFGNKQQIYDCIEQGLITVRMRAEVVKITDREVVYFDAGDQRRHTLRDTDHVFAFIGSEPPTTFLEKIKVIKPKP